VETETVSQDPFSQLLEWAHHLGPADFPGVDGAWVLVWDHRRGTDISLFRHEADLYAALHGVVCANWFELDKLFGEHELSAHLPADERSAIEAYFNARDDEWYVVEYRPISDRPRG
jgi:hypothetical protein